MSNRYAFGHIEVMPEQRALLLHGSRAAVNPRAFDVLVALVERRDRVVPKSELLDAVWPASAVEEHNVVMQVSSLRKLLGDDAIITIPGRGYQWVAASDEPPSHGPAAPAPAPAAPATSQLFGRDLEFAQLTAMAHQHRLVTLIGPGGVGKSSLARAYTEVARKQGAQLVAWVDLGAQADRSMVVGSVASALRLSPGAGDPMEALTRGLQSPAGVVVIDNAEHLVDEVASVVRLLIDHAPELQVLVTSQVPLKLSQEHLLRLDPLAVPEAAADLAEARRHGAVAMFESRAEALDRRFTLDAGNVSRVVELCRRLDGLPLAIELAAARLPLFGIDGLASVLDERFRLLTRGARDAPARHRTLLASLDWSHQLLSTEDQVVFRRLGVFPGSFSLDMARSIAARSTDGSAGGPDPLSVVDSMVSLIDHSFLQADQGMSPRYAMLETMRTYAQSRLVDAGEDIGVRHRHAQAVLAHLDQVNADRWTGRLDAEQTHAMLLPELNNAREAFAFALVHAPAVAVALVPGLGLCLRRHGLAEMARVLEATALHVDDAIAPERRAAWLVEAARFWAGRKPREAAQHGAAAAALFRTAGDRVGLFRSLIAITISDFNGASAEQRAALREAESLQLGDWPPCLQLIGLWARTRVHRIDGENRTALAELQQVVELARRDGDKAIEGRARSQVAELELVVGKPAEALQQALGLAGRLRAAGMLTEVPSLLRTATAARLELGQVQEARQTAWEGWSLARRAGSEPGWTDLLALLAALEGRHDQAATLLGMSDMSHFDGPVARDAIATAARARAEALVAAALPAQQLQELRSAGLDAPQADFQNLVLAVLTGSASGGT